MTVRLSDVPGPAHSAKTAAGPGLPNQPNQHSKGRVSMVGEEIPERAAVALARRQVAGLRALADLLQRRPELAEHLRFGLCHIGQPLINPDGDARGVLEAFRAAAEASPAAVRVVNDPDRCRVVADFEGAVVVTMWAGADLMAGTPQPATYLPLGGGE